MTVGIKPYKESDFIKTNADRIRSMTDEELANWITLVMWGEESSVSFLYAETPEEWLDWLKQEVKE